jgi:hypothetical protein
LTWTDFNYIKSKIASFFLNSQAQWRFSSRHNLQQQTNLDALYQQATQISLQFHGCIQAWCRGHDGAKYLAGDW